jgi:RNA polymerase sigma-70 factor (ECF subfamily)
MSDNLIDINASPFVAKLISGDERAFFELYKQMYPKLCSYVKAKFKFDFDAVQQIAQDTMMNVHQKIREFKPGKPKLTTWIYKIANNLAIDFLRLQKRKIKRDALDVPKLIDSYEDAARQGLLNHESDLIYNHVLESVDVDTPEKELIRDAYNSLNKEAQDILFWKIEREMSYKEISDLTGIDENTLKTRFSRARSKLKRIVKENMRERRSGS